MTPNCSDLSQSTMSTPPPAGHSHLNIVGLPAEIQRIVLMELDHHSLRAILECCPSLRKLFIVIVQGSARADGAPYSKFFGSMQGLSVVAHNKEATRSSYSKYLVTIFEFNEDMITLPSIQKDIIDRWTMALFHVDPLYHRPMTRFTKPLLARGARVYFDYIALSSRAKLEYRPLDPLDVYTFQKRLGASLPTGQIACLKSLDLRDVYHVHNLHLPSLEKASIQFKNGSEGELPSLHDFRAPSLMRLRVLYVDQLPVFTTIRVGKDEPEATGNYDFVKPRGPSSFSLCRIGSLDESLTTALPPCQHSLGTMKAGTFGRMCWSFTREFATLHVVGGPDKLLEMMDVTTASVLIWKKTDLTHEVEDQISSNTILRLNSMFHDNAVLHIETTVPSTVLPQFSFHGVSLCGLIVIDRAGGLDDNGLFSTHAGQILSHMKYLEVHSPVVPASERSSTKGALLIPASLLGGKGYTSLIRVKMSGVLLDPLIDRAVPGTRMERDLPRFSEMRGSTWEYDSSKEFARTFSRDVAANGDMHFDIHGVIRVRDGRARVHLA